MTDTSLTAESLAKRYGKTAVLDGLTHAFAPGLTVVTGPSGGGKSTLLRVLATLEAPSAGKVLWNGADVSAGRKAYRAQLGYAPQSVVWPERLTGSEFLAQIAAMKGLRAREAKAQADALLARVGLGGAGDRALAVYSGGMRRRLGVVQSLLGAPGVILLDEPTAELDAETAGAVEGLLREMAERAVVVMTTHRSDALIAAGARELVVGRGA